VEGLMKTGASSPSTHRIQIKLTSAKEKAETAGQTNPVFDRSSIKEEQPEHLRHFFRASRHLDQLIGLEKVKRLAYEIYSFYWINQQREQLGLKREPHVLHMVFHGNPGTGKTTVARMFGQMFQELGILQKGHLIEVERADLVGEYVGHTAQKTREQVKKALGGILFIDEAYSLARGGEKDFGKEAIDTLVKAMEDYKDEFILILAGYTEEMHHFLKANPGLPSRFPIQLEFADYTVTQLLDIADVMYAEREYQLSAEARLKLKAMLEEAASWPHELPSNARYVRNLVEKSIRNQAIRLMRQSVWTKEKLMMILPEDLQFEDEGTALL
jgi:stage V sporulation protein K